LLLFPVFWVVLFLFFFSKISLPIPRSWSYPPMSSSSSYRVPGITLRSFIRLSSFFEKMQRTCQISIWRMLTSSFASTIHWRISHLTLYVSAVFMETSVGCWCKTLSMWSLSSLRLVCEATLILVSLCLASHVSTGRSPA
jgi:hypothetical protein